MQHPAMATRTPCPKLELKLPPLLLAGIVAALMGLVAWALPGLAFALPARAFAALGLAAAGAAIALLGVRAFARARTTVDPRVPHKSSSLVRSGVYRISRNPMYLGIALLLGAWALWLAHAPALLGVPAFVLYMNRFQIDAEERMLQRTFGADFERYRAQVRRWL